MRRFVIAAVVTALAVLPAVAAAHGATTVSVSGVARADSSIRVDGAGFAPNDTVRIEFRKEGIDPIELGRIPADADGVFTATLHVPANVMPGLYELAADGEDSATTEVPVLAPLSGSPAGATAPVPALVTNNRPRGETAGLAAFTAAIALASLALLWLSRTHPRAGNA